MNFLQKIVFGKVLDGRVKMVKNDSKIGGVFSELGKTARKLQQDINQHIKDSKKDRTYK